MSDESEIEVRGKAILEHLDFLAEVLDRDMMLGLIASFTAAGIDRVVEDREHTATARRVAKQVEEMLKLRRIIPKGSA